VQLKQLKLLLPLTHSLLLDPKPHRMLMLE
jgi:hypothetical protein